jgi:hypothetical protein
MAAVSTDNGVKRSSARRVFKYNQRILNYLFFVLLASLFWLLNSLNNSYTTQVSFKVDLVQPPVNKMLVGNATYNLKLTVQGHGFVLLRTLMYARNHRLTLYLATKEYRPEKFNTSEETNHYYVLTSSSKEEIQAQLFDEVTLLQVRPDSLHFVFSNVISKTIPVKPVVNIQYEKQYRQAGRLIVKPDSIIITGPKLLLDTIYYYATVPQSYQNINHTFKDFFSISQKENIRTNAKKVLVIAPVEEFTEGSVDITITPINKPEGNSIKTFPSKVKVFYTVGLSNYNRVQARQFLVTVDFYSARKSINNKIKVNIDRKPSFVKVENYKPRNVDFIIER